MNILREAERLVHGDRQGDYGHPAEDFGRTAKIWSAILGVEIKAEQVGLCMIGVKLARETHRHKNDNLVDLAGYAQTVAMVHEKGGREGLVYLASPYSHPDAKVRQSRYEAACRVAADLMAQGRFVFSPIAHSHGLSQFGLPTDWGYWEKYDRAILAHCQEVVVLTLEGWQESKGVKAEIEMAHRLGKTVSFRAEENPGCTPGSQVREVGCVKRRW
jgi:hypothetical protein